MPRGDVTPAFVVPDASSPIAGTQDASAPFWSNGQPRLVLNQLVVARQGGTDLHADMLHSSGLPADDGPPAPYRLKFDRAGTFRYVHLRADQWTRRLRRSDRDGAHRSGSRRR